MWYKSVTAQSSVDFPVYDYNSYNFAFLDLGTRRCKLTGQNLDEVKTNFLYPQNKRQPVTVTRGCSQMMSCAEGGGGGGKKGVFYDRGGGGG